jgi:hypothetical protein
MFIALVQLLGVFTVLDWISVKIQTMAFQMVSLWRDIIKETLARCPWIPVEMLCSNKKNDHR